MKPSNRALPQAAWLPAMLTAALWLGAPLAARAQSASEGQTKEGADPAKGAKPTSEGEKKEDPGPARTVQSYDTVNGSQTYSRIEERERKKTADGDIVTERVRRPAYPGDDRVLMEREIRTKKLPDGSIERETILKNPDGNGAMQPIEITRETIRPVQGGSTTERETSKPDLDGEWRTVQRETVREKGDKTSHESTREVAKPDVNGDWKPVVREFNWDKKTAGGETQQSATQAPDATGQLSDFQIQTVQSTGGAEGGTREVTITRRDFSDANSATPVVIEHTVTQEKRMPSGEVVAHTTTESNLVNGGAARNLESSHPEIVEEKDTVETPGKNGATTTTTTVTRRGSAATQLHPSSQIVVQKDSTGHVRQIYLPAQ